MILTSLFACENRVYEKCLEMSRYMTMYTYLSSGSTKRSVVNDIDSSFDV